MYYTTISTNFNNLAAARNECSCSSLNIVLKPLLQKPQHHSQNCSHGWRLWGLKCALNMIDQDMGCMLDGEEQSIRVFYCFLCFQTCVCSWLFMLKKDFCDVLMRSNSLETLLQVLRVWMYRSELNGLTKWNNSTKVTTSAAPLPLSPKTVAITFFAEGVELNFFFRGEFEWCHPIDRLFVCGSL